MGYNLCSTLVALFSIIVFTYKTWKIIIIFRFLFLYLVIFLAIFFILFLVIITTPHLKNFSWLSIVQIKSIRALLWPPVFHGHVWIYHFHIPSDFCFCLVGNKGNSKDSSFLWCKGNIYWSSSVLIYSLFKDVNDR